MLKEVTKDMTIGDYLDADRETVPFFLEMGMHCLGCPASRGETLEQACEVHGVDADALVEKSTRFCSLNKLSFRGACQKPRPACAIKESYAASNAKAYGGRRLSAAM